MITISIDKNLFDDILYKKITMLEKQSSKYWKKELLNPIIVNDKISYQLIDVEKIRLTHGLGDEKPSFVIECKSINYNGKKNIFEFELGKIVEQKNIQAKEDVKDNIIEQLLKEKKELEDKMNKDPLTNIYNRRKLESDLKVFTNQSNSSFLNAVFIDADDFKNINDTFGHDYGDRVLQYLAEKLEDYAKTLNGDVYRYGGEEFIILCFCPKDFLLENLEALRQRINFQKIFHPSKPISVTVSMGVSFFSECKTKDKLLKNADNCLYEAKRKGKDNIVVQNN